MAYTPAKRSTPISDAHLPPAGAPDVLYLIDLSGYVFRAYHAIAPLSSSKGEPTHAVMGTVNMIQKVVNERQPQMLAVAMDAKGTTFRREIDARYKANRPPAPPDLAQQMARCEEIVRAYNIPIYLRAGLEADDLIACVVEKASANGFKVVIVSADKDLMQLVHDEDERVVLWDSMRDKVYGPSDVKTKFGVAPSQLRDLLALTGDTSDNIPGVPSIGPKTASDLLREYGSLENILANLENLKRGKMREMLIAHQDDARISQKLVTLRTDCDIAWDPAHLQYGGANQEELTRLFVELEFTRHLNQLETPSKVERELRTILDVQGLEKVCDEIRARKAFAFHIKPTHSDSTRAEPLGLSISVDAGIGYYVPMGQRYLGAPAQLGVPSVMKAIAPLLEDESIKKVAHDFKFNDVILRRAGITARGPIFDTMIASYLLDPEVPHTLRDLARRELDVSLTPHEDLPKKQRGATVSFDELTVEQATEYAAAEVESCRALAARLEPRVEAENLAMLLQNVEIPLSRVLAEMEATGVLVDIPQLEKLGAQIEVDLRRLETEAKSVAGHDFSVRSRDQLEKILFDELKLRVLKRTPKGGRSTDAGVLEELALEHPLPKLICEFREIDKLRSTYIEALPRSLNQKTGRIHTHFNQTVAATGRLASNDPNLQNIPIRTELGRKIRSAFVAPPGYVLVSADYSQIELRVLAHLSHDEQLIDAFRTSEDVHTRTASLIFGVGKDGVTSEMRRRAKTINFGVIYGMGDSALARQLDISRDEARGFIDAYFERYEGVARFMTQTVESARAGQAVRTILGRRRFLPNLNSSNRGLRLEAERVAKNTPIQGTAADILKIAMVRLGEKPVVPSARMILTVHDELVFEIPEGQVEQAKGRIVDVMSSAMQLDVPLVVDVGAGANWSLAH